MMRADDFRREQRGVALAMAGALAITILILGTAAFLDRTSAAIPVSERLQATLRAEILVVAWLAAAIANVARLRFFSAPDIAGSSVEGGSERVRQATAILQNTLEQVVLATVTHLIVTATIARPSLLVGALVGLFAIGRLLFWRGYRHGAKGRAFGFALTFYPSLVALACAAVTALVGWIA